MYRIFLITMMIISFLFISGCAREERVAALETRIVDMESKMSYLESKVDSVDQKQVAAEERYDKFFRQKEQLANAQQAKSMTIQELQKALRNAGFYVGSIDGKMGPSTLNAIKEFQKANGLKADGVAGTKTKNLLIGYLAKET